MFSRSRRFISASGATVVDAVAAVAAMLACIAFNEVAKHPGRIKPRILKRWRLRYPPMQRPRNQLRAELAKT